MVHRGYHLGEAVLQIEEERKCEVQHAAEAEGAPEWGSLKIFKQEGQQCKKQHNQKQRR